MANPHDFKGSNRHYGPPPGLDEMVGHLHVFMNGQVVVSAWKPTPEELAKLNAGESIFVSVMSGSNVFPIYVGCEETCRTVASDTGKVW